MEGLHKYLLDSEREQLLKWLKGNTVAADAVAQILAISHVWDDLIDRDKPISEKDINMAFVYSLVGLSRNSFWRAYQNDMTLLLEMAIIDWMTANHFERNKNFKEASFVLRCGAASVIVKAASIIGGFDHAVQVSNEVREQCLDDFDKYCKQKEHGGIKNGMA